VTGRPDNELLYALPKTDLHVHLDGSLRISTVRELAAKHKLPFNFQTDDDVRAVCQVNEQCESLEDYLKVFDITLQLMQTKEELERIAFELAEDAHNENIRYMEVRYSPMLHTIKGLKLDEIVEAVQNGLDRARRQFGIVTGQIVCGIRHISVESSLELADLAVRWKNRGVVAFDLAGAEKDFPAKDHIQAFYKVLNANMPVTVHAGEAFGAPSIHQAVHYCGATAHTFQKTWIYCNGLMTGELLLKSVWQAICKLVQFLIMPVIQSRSLWKKDYESHSIQTID